MRRSSLWRLLAAAALVAVFAACGSGAAQPQGELSSLNDLRGRMTGVASLNEVSTLELRYVLRAGYHLDAERHGGDVTLVESPGDALQSQLEHGVIDAAVLPPKSAFALRDDSSVQVLSHLAKEMRNLTAGPVLATALITYSDVAAAKAGAIDQLNTGLAESLTYFKANQDAVIDAIAANDDERAYLRWWWQRQDLLFGDASPATQRQVVDLWAAAKNLGDIDAYPEIASAMVRPQRQPSGQGTVRTTVTLAVLDDPGRRCALYALERGIVSPQAIDVNLTYLPVSLLSDAALAKQFDVIEASPMIVPTDTGSRLSLRVLSGGLQDLDGTLLFVRSKAR